MSNKVSCLMVTHGRYRHVRQALACFLAQDYESRELLILNHHEVPLLCDQPSIRVFNEPNELTYGANLNRLLAHVDGEFLRSFDDDDFYLPWAISQGVERIGDAVAWKPLRSWFYDGARLSLEANNFEPSVTWRTDFVRRIGYHACHHDHENLHAATAIKTDDMNYWASFLTTWGTGVWHLSGSLGNGQSAEQRAATWRANNQQHGGGEPLTPDYTAVQAWWHLLLNQIPEAERGEWCDEVFK